MSRGNPLLALLATIASCSMHILNWRPAPAALAACSYATHSCTKLLTLLAALPDSAAVSHAASLFSLLAASCVRPPLVAPPLSAPSPTPRNLCTSQHFEARSSSHRAAHSLTASQAAQRILDQRETSHALATPLVGAAVPFTHCPQPGSACTLFIRRACTDNSSPVRQQQSTQGSGASQHPFSSCRSP